MLKCRTLRRTCSITKNQYQSWKVRVGTVKKSKATVTSRWLARKASQRLPGSPRRRRRCRYLATVRSETSKPSFSSSPWICGAPQSEFSAATRRIRVRISSLTLGRPRLGRDRPRQYRRKPARCHPTTVFGFTMTRTSDHRGHMYRRLVQKKRSRRFSKGRGPLSFQHGDLLPESENFERYLHASAEEDSDRSQQCEDQIEHE